MAIYFDGQSRIFYLESSGLTYAFGVNRAGLLEHLYFGSRIGRDVSFPVPRSHRTGFTHAVYRHDEEGGYYDLALTPQEIHTPYSGDFYEPSLILEYANGNRRSDLVFEDYEIVKEKPAIPGLPSVREGETLILRLRSKTARVTLFYTVSGKAAVLMRSVKIENLGEEALRVNRAYSFAFTLPNKDYQAVYLPGASCRERHVAQTSLQRGTFVLDSKRGVSSAAMNPFLAVGEADTTEHRGDAYGVNLIYSGSYALKAERLPSGQLRVLGGLSDFDFSWKLEPGEAFWSPEAVLAFSPEGYSGLSRQFHRIYREALLPGRFVKQPRPMILNHWEATRFSFTGEKLQDIIRRAVGTGVDTFVVDDGWFGKREDETSSLGDWVVNEEKLGGSLQKLIAFTHEKGLKFGLWIEPEMISRDSDLYRQHPDWAIQTPDEAAAETRCQLMLDLSRDEVRDYIADCINALLRTYEIDYVKWDCNRELTEGYSLALPPDRQRELFHRQILGLYDLFHRIVEGNPGVFFEGCASGGSRFDPGILYYFPQIWTSDQTDALARTKIQYGTSLCYPLSSMSCHVTASPNKRAAHLTSMEARVDMASLGAMGYELDVTRLSEEELAKMPEQIAACRADEDLVLEGEVYRLAAPFGASNFFAMQLVSPDRRRSRITVMKLQQNYNEPEPRIYPQGLDPDLTYESEGVRRKGSSWMCLGIEPGCPERDYGTQVYRLRAVEEGDH